MLKSFKIKELQIKVIKIMSSPWLGTGVMWEESFSAFLRCLSSSQIASNPGFFPDDAAYEIILLYKWQ